MAETDLAIIGCGASAVLLLAALAKNPAAAGMRVDIYERSGNYGRGLAYSTQNKGHLLNVRAAQMSAYEDDREDFANWAAGKGYGPLDFVPRMVFGDYLEEKLEGAKKALTLNFLKSDVETVKNQDKDLYEVLSGSRKRNYTSVVQATGNVRPISPKVEKNVTGYIDNPWNADFGVLAKLENITLVGSGLSAVDTILALYAKGFSGKITVMSRHGLFPAAHTEPYSYPSFIGEEEEKMGATALFLLIRAKVRDAAAQGVPWQAVIDSLRPHINTIWAKWYKRERERFLKRLYTIWNVHRHRMAPQIADAVNTLVRAGKVDVIKSSVDMVGAGPVIHGGGKEYKADAVINCLGYRYKEEGRTFDVSDRIGPCAFGELFETTAIPEIRAQAAEIAARVLTHYHAH